MTQYIVMKKIEHTNTSHTHMHYSIISIKYHNININKNKSIVLQVPPPTPPSIKIFLSKNPSFHHGGKGPNQTTRPGRRPPHQRRGRNRQPPQQEKSPTENLHQNLCLHSCPFAHPSHNHHNLDIHRIQNKKPGH